MASHSPLNLVAKYGSDIFKHYFGKLTIISPKEPSAQFHLGYGHTYWFQVWSTAAQAKPRSCWLALCPASASFDQIQKCTLQNLVLIGSGSHLGQVAGSKALLMQGVLHGKIHSATVDWLIASQGSREAYFKGENGSKPCGRDYACAPNRGQVKGNEFFLCPRPRVLIGVSKRKSMAEECEVQTNSQPVNLEEFVVILPEEMLQGGAGGDYCLQNGPR